MVKNVHSLIDTLVGLGLARQCDLGKIQSKSKITKQMAPYPWSMNDGQIKMPIDDSKINLN